MKKNEIYVVIDTPKKAKKVKKVLDMFGERYGSATLSEEDDYKGIFQTLFYNEFEKEFWIGKESRRDGKTEVSIKELKQILAIEHLKEGDVVVTKVNNEKIIAVYDRPAKSNIALFQAKRWVRVSDGFKWNQEGCFDTFLRYATEEEKALLEDKLTIADYKLGVWYKSKNGSLIYFNDTDDTYGFFADGEFYDKIEWVNYFKDSGFHKPGNWVEAKDKEVITALEKESEKRFGTDWLNVKIKDHVEGLNKWIHLNDGTFATYQHFTDRLYNKNGLIYYNGKWAEILEEPKSIEAGKWYKGNGDKLIFTTSYEQDGHVKAYGFGVMGGWYDDDNTYTWTAHDLKEATKEEVEQALIKEAKKRGYVEGARIKCLYFGQEYTITSEKHWEDFDGKELLMVESEGTGVWIFKNGKWAEIVEPSFVESASSNVTLEVKDIAVIEQLHDLLLDVHGYSLDYKLLKDARELEEKLTKLI